MTKEKEVIGRIIGISELNVKVLLFSENVKINDILTCEDEEGIRKFEVVQIDNNVASTVPFERVIGLKKGEAVTLEDGGLQIEYSDEILGNVIERDLWVDEGDVVGGFEAANEAIGTLVLRFESQKRIDKVLSSQDNYVRVILK